jgi:HK97 family phage major capsid protein
MNAQLKSLYDKKGKIVNEMKDAYRLVSERKGENAGVATADEKRQFESWDKELEDVQASIELNERMAKLDLISAAQKAVEVESDANKGKRYNEKATALERRTALAKATKVGYSGLSEEERTIVDTEHRDMAIFEKMLRGRELNAEELRVLNTFREKRAQSVGTTTAGGYTVPEGFAGRIVEYMKYISNLLNFANIIRTETGNTIPFPINDDTSNTGELIGENSDLSSASADLVFSVYNLGAYKFSSKMVKVSSELIQDNGVDLISYLAKKLAERVARITNTYFTTGTGSSQPQGYLAASAATRGKVTASTSTFTSAEMIAFQDSIDIAYQANASWAFHQNILSEVKQLTIGTNYNTQLWVPSFREGEPDRILGKPFFINQAMSSTSATGDKIMAYGDFSKFNIRIVNDFTLRALSERYAEFDQTAWFGLMRCDSFLENTAAVKYMDIS